MDLAKELLKQPTPEWTAEVRDYVCTSKDRFNLLMNIFLNHHSHDYRLNQRAGLIILSVEQVRMPWVVERIPDMVKVLHPNLSVAYKRNALRLLQNHKIPEHLWGHAADQCFQYLASSEEPVAVKVFSMTVLFNLTKDIPELATELRMLIEDQYPFGSPGFKARGRKVLKALQKDGH
ncbi:MAG: hypothetical protein OER04_03790 [Cyclobacteriaceae bacterium]|nr:hypothetical protein [Cyclobacteriaceae bacterium]